MLIRYDNEEVLFTRSVRELMRYAVASVCRREYLCTLGSAGRLDRLFRNAMAHSETESALRKALKPYFGDNIREGDAADEIVARVIANRGTKSLLQVRTYVALSVAYSYAVLSPLLEGHWWLDPWKPWRLYLAPPNDDFEYRFAGICAVLGDLSKDVAEKQLLSGSNSRVGDMVDLVSNRLRASVEREPQSSRAESGSQAFDDILGTCRRLDLPDSDAPFAFCFRMYIVMGRMRWRKTLFGYRLQEGGKGDCAKKLGKGGQRR
jgi:hypothetical protein